MSRAQGTRICVEIDLQKNLQKEIVVEWGNQKRVFEVIYENMPLFCKYCSKRGHKEEACKNKEIVKRVEDKPENKEADPTQANRINNKDKIETTKAWVSRVFHTRGKRPIWPPKRLNPKIIDTARLITANDTEHINLQNHDANTSKGKGKMEDCINGTLVETSVETVGANEIVEDSDEVDRSSPEKPEDSMSQNTREERHSKSMEIMMEDKIRREVGDIQKECNAPISLSDNEDNIKGPRLSMKDIIKCAKDLCSVQMESRVIGEGEEAEITLSKEISEKDHEPSRKKRLYTPNPDLQRQTRSIAKGSKSQDIPNTSINE